MRFREALDQDVLDNPVPERDAPSANQKHHTVKARPMDHVRLNTRTDAQHTQAPYLEPATIDGAHADMLPWT
jgi:hypothetical protein